jgi:DNA polymerase I-like protein with 3'-5' exonuclease and polymerase domains
LPKPPRPAADVLKLAMVRTAAMLPSDVRMVATVHDELILDSPSSEAAQYSAAWLELIRVFTDYHR